MIELGILPVEIVDNDHYYVVALGMVAAAVEAVTLSVMVVGDKNHY